MQVQSGNCNFVIELALCAWRTLYNKFAPRTSGKSGRTRLASNANEAENFAGVFAIPSRFLRECFSPVIANSTFGITASSPQKSFVVYFFLLFSSVSKISKWLFSRFFSFITSEYKTGMKNSVMNVELVSPPTTATPIG